MADLRDLRRRRLALESERATLGARRLAAERRLADAELAADKRTAKAAASRLASLKRDEGAAAAELRANEGRIGILVEESGAARPASSPEAPEPDLLGGVPSDVPVLLLPVRVETRFRGTPPNRELLVRVFPDDIHVDTHEPGLTNEERTAGERYWRDAWKTDTNVDKAAWNQLASAVGAERAAWIARALTPVNLKKRPAQTPTFPDVPGRLSSWSRAARATTLPDRWIVLGYEDGVRVFAVTGGAIPDVLAVGPEPEGDEASRPRRPDTVLDAGMQWLIDFDQAVKVGMGLRIPLPANAQQGLSRLMVFGVKRSADADESVDLLQSMFDAHHYTRGLGFIPPGTPTNNTTHTSSGFDSRDLGNARSHGRERGKPLFSAAGNADGAIVARALGVDPETFQHTSMAGEDHLSAARSMNTALWPGTLGYYLEQRLAGTTTDEELRQIRRHFIDHVRGGGTLPSLRVGRQPYGFLPVTSLDRWQPAEDSDPAERSLEILRALREAFRRASTAVPRISNEATLREDMLAVMPMRPYSAGHNVRHVFGHMFLNNAANFAGSALPPEWWAAHMAIVKAPAVGGITPTIAQSLATLAPHLDPVSAAPRVSAEGARPDYLTKLAEGGFRAALDAEDASNPQPMLYRMARHALLRAYAQAADRIARRADALPQGHLEPELIDMDPNAPTETIWRRLEKPVPGVTGARTLGAFLDAAANERNADVKELGDTRAALRELAGVNPDHLERLLMETLDLATHRLDAWVSSLAARRLARLRQQTPAGVRLGGYGWLEHVRPADKPVSSGFVQVPSVDHAAMAAVLASGYLSNLAKEGQSPFALDLSSDRVRHARWLLQGVRAGQTLGSLVGYRIERVMQERDLAGFIADLVGAGFSSGGPGIDGVKLLEARRSGNDNKFNGVTGGMTNDQKSRFIATLDLADRDVDALADLLLAEGVFHATRGNFDRAGQTVGAVTAGQSLPEPESMDTPRTGVIVSHRVVKFLAGSKPASSSPRAQAEPRLNAWLADVIGDTRRLRCRVLYSFDGRNVERTIAPTELKLEPIDWVSSTNEELEQIILSRASRKRPARVPASAAVQIDRTGPAERNGLAWTQFTFVLESARKLLASVRPLLGADLAPADRGTPGVMDLREIMTRADRAVAQLRKASTAGSADGLFAFGILSSLGGTTKESTERMKRAAKEATERLKRISQMETGFKRDAAAPEKVFEHDGDRIRAVFGGRFPVLPLFKAGNGPELARSFGKSTALQGDDPLAATAWLDRIGHVRPRVAKFHDVARLVSALDGSEEAASVAQLPFVQGDRWIALPAPVGSTAAGKIGIVAIGPTPSLTGTLCGIVVDEWTEMIPNARESTGLVFQFDRPAARPPQACLLAVPPDAGKSWDMETLEATLLETLELANLRLVDQVLLTEFDHYLPALQFALNVANDTVSTDFR